MNHNGVLTTGEELYEHNYEAYETFREEGTYRMKLDFRSWLKCKKHHIYKIRKILKPKLDNNMGI